MKAFPHFLSHGFSSKSAESAFRGKGLGGFFDYRESTPGIPI
jgi:hypothetical protein